MAIVKCRECGRDVSSQAETCPHCGIKAPAPYQTNAARGRLILIGIGAIVVFMIVMSFQSSKKSDSSGAPTSAPSPPNTGASITAPVPRAELSAAANKALDEAESAKRAKFVAERKTILAKMKQYLATRQYQKVKDIGDEYAWVGDRELNDYANFARDKLRDAAIREAKAQRRREGVSIGMTQQQVLESSWGKPGDVNRTTTVRGTHEQWVYPGNHAYLYFDDGILTGIQN